jgi:hypothetical protein
VSDRAFRRQSFLMHLYYIMEESAREREEKSESMTTRPLPSYVDSLISAHMACVVSSLSSA